MNILAIDPGTKLGWALKENGRLEWGTETFDVGRHESRGMRWVKFNRWLNAMLIPLGRLEARVDLIVYEQSHQRGGAATEIAGGFVTRIHEACARINEQLPEGKKIEYTSCHTASLKKFATGKGRADKEAMKFAASGFCGMGRSKQSMADWAEFMDKLTDDEADAICLLHWAEKECGGKDDPKGWPTIGGVAEPCEEP